MELARKSALAYVFSVSGGRKAPRRERAPPAPRNRVPQAVGLQRITSAALESARAVMYQEHKDQYNARTRVKVCPRAIAAAVARAFLQLLLQYPTPPD